MTTLMFRTSTIVILLFTFHWSIAEPLCDTDEEVKIREELLEGCNSHLHAGGRAAYYQALSVMSELGNATSTKALALMNQASESGFILARIFSEIAVTNGGYDSFAHWTRISNDYETGLMGDGNLEDYKILGALSLAQETLLKKAPGAPLSPDIIDWLNAKDESEHYIQAALWALSTFNEKSSGDLSINRAAEILNGVGNENAVARNFYSKLLHAERSGNIDRNLPDAPSTIHN